MIGDALGDAYEHAADQISFVANTVIDTVDRDCEQARKIIDMLSCLRTDVVWLLLHDDLLLKTIEGKA